MAIGARWRVAWWLLGRTTTDRRSWAGAVTGGAILTALATVAVQPHRFVPRGADLAGAAVSPPPLSVVALTCADRLGGRDDRCHLRVRELARACRRRGCRRPRSEGRRTCSSCCSSPGALVEIAEGHGWPGGAEPTRAQPLIGTFYWWDPFAAFLFAGDVIGCSFWLRRRVPVAAFGLFGCYARRDRRGLFDQPGRPGLLCRCLLVVAWRHCLTRAPRRRPSAR